MMEHMAITAYAKKIKILFLIHDLGQGGAEKVLINLVNNMDQTKFDITVMALFAGGVNEPFLAPHIRYKTVWKKAIPGNSKLMKLLTPKQLHKLYIKETYDIEVAYLEGPSTRIVAGSPHESTKLVSWIHVEQHTLKRCSASYRNVKELLRAYQRMDRIVAVSDTVRKDFETILQYQATRVEVLYNTNESDKVMQLSKELVSMFEPGSINLIAVGSLKPVKGFDRLIRVHSKLRQDGYNVHTYVLGKGPQQAELERLAQEMQVSDSFTLLGYDTNPYKYVSKANLFVCSSLREGFSTAATEALIVGTPVCTVEVSGMKEMLGENDEYGVVTGNSEEALYEGIKRLLDDPDLLVHYKRQAAMRGKEFSTEKTVRAVEKMFLALMEK